MLLGVIADDFTGATDIASMLVKNGMRTVQLIGVPCADFDCPEADAVVVALKSRTTPVANAVSESCEALKWLKAKRARQIYFKYCSTFDSTAEGNIGPVIDALMDAVETDFTVAAPAFPANKRTVFKGYLFAGDVLLSESGMRNHPLTPMTDSNLVRVLQAQTNSKVGLISFETVDAGPAKIKAQIDQLRASGIAIAIVDAIDDMSLLKIGEACAGLALVTGGSGLAMGLPENFRRSGQLSVTSTAAE